MLNALIVFIMPIIFYQIMAASSFLKNDILRVAGVFIGFTGMMASIIYLVVRVIIWVG